MSVNTVIQGKKGFPLNINGEGEASVVVHPHPPKDESTNGSPLPFRQYFTDNGKSTGSEDMTVDGSSTAQEFFIGASQDYDIYIKSISLSIGDGGSPTLNKFGAINALSSGVEWIYFNQSEGDYELHGGIKTNLEFIRLGVDTGSIGTGTDAYLADVSGGAAEKNYLPVIDMKETFGLQWGLRLVKGSTDRVVFRINDDLLALTTFNAIGYGIRF
jgi:hypothetical protein